MNSRKTLIIFASTALIPAITFASALLGANISDGVLLASLLPLVGGAIYAIVKLLRCFNGTVLTVMHIGVWLFLFSGLIFEFKIPLYLAVIVTLAALYVGLVQMIALIGFGFIACLIIFAATRKLWSANLLIFSFCCLVFQICSIIIALPGAAAH
jgi:hypothetical protein